MSIPLAPTEFPDEFLTIRVPISATNTLVWVGDKDWTVDGLWTIYGTAEGSALTGYLCKIAAGTAIDDSGVVLSGDGSITNPGSTTAPDALDFNSTPDTVLSGTVLWGENSGQPRNDVVAGEQLVFRLSGSPGTLATCYLFVRLRTRKN